MICVSRWSFTKNHYMMHGQQNVKKCWIMCFSVFTKKRSSGFDVTNYFQPVVTRITCSSLDDSDDGMVMIQILGLGYLFLLRWVVHVACVVGRRGEYILHPTITPY